MFLEVFFFVVICFMFVILGFFKSESDKLLLVYDSFLMCFFVYEKLSWDYLNLFFLGFWIIIKNGFVLDLVGFWNENVIMLRIVY